MDQQQSLDSAKKYLEDILSFFGENIAVEAMQNDDYIELTVPSSALNSILIGRSAETLRSLQYLVTTMLRNNSATLVKVNLDIADYKKQRAEQITDKARGWIEKVRETGESYVAHLNAADRRVVHRLADEYDDIQTFSEGEGRDRSIIIAQKTS